MAEEPWSLEGLVPTMAPFSFQVLIEGIKERVDAIASHGTSLSSELNFVIHTARKVTACSWALVLVTYTYIA